MIIVKLMGGLGNQMFQYACGRALAARNNSDLLLDLSFLQDRSPKKNFTYRDFELDAFQCENKFATNDQLQRFKKAHLKERSSLLHKFFKKNHRYNYITEESLDFQGYVKNANGNILLQGYFQSEKYFYDKADIIHKDFQFKKTIPSSQSIETQILSSNSISIHLRRGDYANNVHINQYHGVCDLEYYKDAIDYIAKKILQPVFFIFSDDLGWVLQNLKIDYPTYIVEGNIGEYSFEDMRLMSLCKNNIIANSSFSWWGAWLNKNEKKIVIAPKKWLGDNSIDTNDILPEKWIKL